MSGPTDTIVARLRAAGCVFAEDEAAILIADAATPAELESRVERRVAGEPLEYIVGWAEFAGLRVAVAPGVFVPRQRTTLLAREALRVAPRAPIVLDLCCGAGAVGAAILAARPDATVHAADIDPVAVECARRTLSSLRWSSSAAEGDASFRRSSSAAEGDVSSRWSSSAAEGDVSSRWSSSAAGGDAYRDPATHTYTGDLYAPLPRELAGTVDVLVANAPYVPTDEIAFMPSEARDHEALAALDGGADGLQLQRRVADGALQWLAPGGHVLIETSRRQASATAELLESAGFAVSIVRDDDVAGTVAVGALTSSAPASPAPSLPAKRDG